MSANQTHAEMHPARTCLQTLFATVGGWCHIANFGKMTTFHRLFPSLRKSDDRTLLEMQAASLGKLGTGGLQDLRHPSPMWKSASGERVDFTRHLVFHSPDAGDSIVD